MEIREIDYILAICDCGSMSGAAEKLFITQSALSKYVQSLESRLGYPLFHRENHFLLPISCRFLSSEGIVPSRLARGQTISPDIRLKPDDGAVIVNV